jgi:RNA polymerase sigma factor (sigma-70 family)
LAAVPSIGRADSVEQRTAPEADATRGLYERHSRQIFNYCVHQLGSREEAEDATQIVFMNAFRALQRGVVPELESAWLFKIANNVILTRRRSSSRRRRVESPGDLDAIQDLLPSRQSDSDELLRLNEALGEMPEQQRKALLLREWQGLSYREIGDQLGLSQSAVETLLFRARRTLANGLTEAPKAKKLAGRLRGGLDFGSVFAGLKALLSGGAAVKVAVTAAAVATTAVASETQLVRQHMKPEPKAPLVATAGAVRQPSGGAGAPTPVAAAAARAAAQAAPPAADPGPTLADARHRPPVHAAASLAAAVPAAALAEQAPAAVPVAAEAPAAAPEPAAAVPAPAAPAPAVVGRPAPLGRNDGDKTVKQDEHRGPATTIAPAPTPAPTAGRSAGEETTRKDDRKTATPSPAPTTSSSAWTSTSTPTATTPAPVAQQPPQVKELLARLKDAKGRSDERDRQWAPTPPPAAPTAVTTTTASVTTTTTTTAAPPPPPSVTPPPPATPAPPATTATTAQPPEPVQQSNGSGWGRDKDKDRSDRGRRD